MSHHIADAIQHHDYASLQSLIDATPQNLLEKIVLSHNDYIYPLHLAANLGDVVAGAMLLDRMDSLGVPVDTLRDRDDNTAHHWAALNGHTDFVNLLLAHGSNVRVQNALHTLPIHDAAKFGHTGLIELYVELYGPEMLAVTNRYGETPLHRIVTHGHMETASTVMDVIQHYGMGFAGLKRLYGMVTNTGYTPYDFVCWRLLQPFYIKGDSSVLRRKFELLRDLMRAHGANIHSETWKHQGDDTIRAAYNPTAQVEWEILNTQRNKNGVIVLTEAIA